MNKKWNTKTHAHHSELVSESLGMLEQVQHDKGFQSIQNIIQVIK